MTHDFVAQRREQNPYNSCNLIDHKKFFLDFPMHRAVLAKLANEAGVTMREAVHKSLQELSDEKSVCSRWFASSPMVGPRGLLLTPSGALHIQKNTPEPECSCGNLLTLAPPSKAPLRPEHISRRYADSFDLRWHVASMMCVFYNIDPKIGLRYTR
jgi:hypothetical protein